MKHFKLKGKHSDLVIVLLIGKEYKLSLQMLQIHTMQKKVVEQF